MCHLHWCLSERSAKNNRSTGPDVLNCVNECFLFYPDVHFPLLSVFSFAAPCCWWPDVFWLWLVSLIILVWPYCVSSVPDCLCIFISKHSGVLVPACLLRLPDSGWTSCVLTWLCLFFNWRDELDYNPLSRPFPFYMWVLPTVHDISEQAAKQ